MAESTTTDPTVETERLVAAARAGDRAAFGTLYERYARMVHGLLLARVSRGDAADLVHDVFLKAMRSIDQLREPAAFGSWLASIARRRATDHLRRTPSVQELDEEQGAVAMTPSVDPAALAALQALRSLPDAYRETLSLRLVEGLTGPEIAQRTGLTPGSVRVNLHRGFKLLRERLGGEL